MTHTCTTHIHTHTHTTSAGKNTAEYKTVRTHLETIAEALKLQTDAFCQLTQKVKANNWLSLSSKCSEEKLVFLIISRIELNASQFEEFTSMLCDIEGMDLVVNILKGEY